MWESLANLFIYMDPIVYILFIAGIVCCLFEMLTPGFGVFGICGVICLVLAIILRMVNEGDIFMLIYMLLFTGTFLGVLFFVFARSVRKGFLSKSSIMNIDVAPTQEGKAEGTSDFSNLIGTKGTTTTMLRPVGQVKFDNEYYDCITQAGIVLDAGIQVECVNVEGQRIIVKQISK